MYDKTNESQLDFFKDEAQGIPIVEFCGIRSKMYSYLLADLTTNKTGKGIKKIALKNRITHEDYKRCLFGNRLEDKKQHIDFFSIRSKNHQICTIQINKSSLNVFDDKRYIYDGINSYSYGHWRINNTL